MKKIISAVLTVAMLVGASTVAYAKPQDKASKSVIVSNSTTTGAIQTKGGDKKIDVKSTASKEVTKKVDEKKNNELVKAKEALLRKCDEMIAQINKLKGYIVSSDGKFLVEFKDQAAGDAALKTITDAIAKVEAFKTRIEAATTSQELKAITKELQNNWMKHQTIMKRITGLTSAARLKKAYDQTKVLVDKLGAGINGITGSSVTLDVEALKKDQEKIVAELEAARLDYLEVVAMYSSIPDTSKSEKSFKDAQKKLMEAKDELHDVLSDVKKLLGKIKTSVSKQLDAIKTEDKDDDDKDVDEDQAIVNDKDDDDKDTNTQQHVDNDDDDDEADED